MFIFLFGHIKMKCVAGRFPGLYFPPADVSWEQTRTSVAHTSLMTPDGGQEVLATPGGGDRNNTTTLARFPGVRESTAAVRSKRDVSVSFMGQQRFKVTR